MRQVRTLVVGSACVAFVLAALVALASAGLGSAPIAPIENPKAASFDAAAVFRGAALAKLGDCSVCHTREGGATLAGGRAIGTPFGGIYASNLTPDPQTGLGRWSEVAFARAMRSGLSRDGSELYPAFPFEHFASATDQDLSDLYAFLMSRNPTVARTAANRLIPPLGFRPLMMGWKLLFFRPRPTPPVAGRSAAWNRGRYLAEGLAHCGACHTPRGLLGQEDSSHPYAGGWADGWYAPPLNAASPAPRAWTADELYTYLRSGLSRNHSAAAGPMGEVVRELSEAPENDVTAIADYVAANMGTAAAPEPGPIQAVAHDTGAGAALFAGACGACHAAGSGMTVQGRPELGLSTALWSESPRDALQIVLRGLKAPTERKGPFMPAFADALSDAQVAQLAAYMRARFTSRPPWPGLQDEARKARKDGMS